MFVSDPARLRATRAPTMDAAPAWRPDGGDGTYRNPVLFADYSDPDAIRVGDDYWLTASSFSHVPGLPILHSHDLVNWTLVNHALPQLVPAAHFSQPRHGGGVWAPAIRHHAGKFWIFYPDPDFGIYVVTADDPRGAWSAPAIVKAGRGLIDPCPFWDDNGMVYLVHGWAKSRSGIKNRLTLHRLDSAGTSMIDAGEVIIDGDQMKGWDTIEGPKLYKRQGYYYVFAPAGGVRDGYQAVFRARNLRGPYEARIVLAQGRTTINGPHQGAWVDTAEGSHWFLHFQELPVYGRVVHLQPMHWRDGWPAMGDARDGDGPGEPVMAHRKPRALATAAAEPATSDDFTAPTLGRQWQWQANPGPDWVSLQSGALRLPCASQEPGATLWHAGHLLMQKFPAAAFVVTTRLSFSLPNEGDRGGLVVFGYDYAWFGLRSGRGARRLVLSACTAAHQGGTERELHGIDFAGDAVDVRVRVGPDGECQFSYGMGDGEFQAFGPVFRATSSAWVGAKVGLFASAGPCVGGTGAAGFIEAGWFRVSAA